MMRRKERPLSLYFEDFTTGVEHVTRGRTITETVVAFYGIDKLRFVKPVFAGDTIHVRKSVVDTLTKGGEVGIVTFDTTVLNQKQETVLVYRDKLAIKKRPAEVSAS